MNYSELYLTHLHSEAWKETRRRVIERAGRRCERCSDMAFLEVHHKHYRTLGREELP